MRFRSRPSPPPFLSRRDQWRLILMIGALALVLIGVQITSNAEFWTRTGLFADRATPIADTGRPSADGDGEIDFGVQFDGGAPLAPDEFRAERTPDQQPPVKQAEVAEANSDADNAAAEPAATQAATESGGESESSFPLDTRPLSVVRDNTLGIRREEADAYYALLARLQNASPRELQRAATDRVAFRAVMLDAEEYRGRLLTIEGDLRRLTELPVPDSSLAETHGVTRLYEAWIFTPDSGNNPWRVVATEIAGDLPLGESIDPPIRVRVTGAFFKRVGYASHGGLHTTPLLLARRIRPALGAVVVPAPDSALVNYVLTGVLAVGAALAVGIWRFTRGDRTFKEKHLKRVTAAPPEAIDALRGVEAVETSEMLRKLAEAERAGEAPKLS